MGPANRTPAGAFRDLHVLITVARRGGALAKAEAAFGVSQPVVSAVVGEVEHIIGVRLFDRSTKGVEPTPVWRGLAQGRHGRHRRPDPNHQRDGQIMADPSGGEVKIGCPQRTSAVILPPGIQRLSRQYPRSVFSSNRRGGSDARSGPLRERSLDVALV